MQTNRKSFGTLKNDRYVQVAVMDEWPLWQVLLYIISGNTDIYDHKTVTHPGGNDTPCSGSIVPTCALL